MAILAEPRRRKLLELLWSGERAAGEVAQLMPEVTFGAVSQHLKVLRDAGIVSVRKQGRQRFYKAERAALGPLEHYFRTLWRSRLRTFKAQAEAAERRKRKNVRRRCA